MLDSRNISTIFSFDTEYSADSVEWCPHEPNQNVFVCASYFLLENQILNGPTKRIGKILLFSVTHESGLTLHQTINTAAVLDQKWSHYKIHEFSLLGVVNASKKLEIYKLNKNIEMELLSSYELQDNEPETLILSLDWSTGIYKSDEPEIVCSDSKGNIHLLQLVCNQLRLLNSWHGHDFEAWITAFYYWDINIFFSARTIDTFIKKNSMDLISRFNTDLEFLNHDPKTWGTQNSYTNGREIIMSLRVVNDTAERSVKLMEEWSPNKGEKQIQYVFQCVQEHRKIHPNCKKDTLKQIF